MTTTAGWVGPTARRHPHSSNKRWNKSIENSVHRHDQLDTVMAIGPHTIIAARQALLPG